MKPRHSSLWKPLALSTVLLLAACGREVQRSQPASSAARFDQCIVNGVSYSDGDTVPSPDSCNTCVCDSRFGGAAVMCTQMACFK